MATTRGASPGAAPSADLFRRLVESVAAVTYVVEVGRAHESPLYVSPQAERVLGISSERLRVDAVRRSRLVHPGDRERIWNAAASVDAAGEGTWDEEYRIVLDDGGVRWLRDQAISLRASEDGPAYWVGVLTDLTRTREAELAHRELETKYRDLVEQVPAVVYITSNDASPTTLYVSPQAATVLGHPPAAWTTRPELWSDSIHPDDRRRVLQTWGDSVASGQPYHAEYRILRPHGEVVWLDDDANLVRDVDGRPLFWQGLMLDVTDRRWADQELRASEARYRALVEQLPAAVYEMGPDDERRTLYVSPHVEQVLGYTRQEWLDQPDIWIELLHPDDRELELEAHDRHTETGEPWSQEYRLIASDGRVVWVRDQAVLVPGGDGGRRWQGVMLDITMQKELEARLRSENDLLELRALERTAELEEANEMMSLEIGERRRIEEELRTTKDRYRRLVEDVPAVVYIWQFSNTEADPQYYTSPQIERMLGFTVSEWNNDDLWIERLHPDDRERVMAAAERSRSTGEPFELEYRFFARDGRIVWVLDHASLLARDEDARPYLFQGVFIDITARREAEEKAALAEERYRVLSEESPAIGYEYVLDRETDQVAPIYLNPRIATVMGDAVVEDPSRWIERIHPDDRAWVVEAMREHCDRGEPWHADFRVIASDGHIVWLYAEDRCVGYDEQGRPSRFRGLMLDITERKLREEALERDLDRFKTIVEQLPGVPWIEIVEGEPGSNRIVYLGPQLQRILGYTPDELVAEPDHQLRLIHPEDREWVAALSTDHDRTGEPWSATYRVVASDGRVVWLHTIGQAVRDELGRMVWYGISFDITDDRPDRAPTPSSPRARHHARRS